MATDPTTRLLPVGHRHIQVTEMGSGAPVLLLHGGGPGASGLSNFARNIDALSRQFRLIIPDMPGYGGSTKGLGRTDPFGELAEAMRGVLDSLDIEKAHLVGNSLGGACALRLALEHPGRVSSLILMGPGGVDTTRSLPTHGLQKLLKYYDGTGPSLEKLRAFLADLVFDPRDLPEDLVKARYEASIDPEVVANPPLRRPKTLALSRIDFTRDRRLRLLSHPVLVLWGREDRVNRASGALSLLRRLPNADLHLFSRTGHWVQWERADEFNSMTLHFLARNESASPIHQER